MTGNLGLRNHWVDSVADIKDFYWLPAGDLYYVLPGFEWFVDDGVEGHDNFVIRRGTYYGGPPIYDPKGLLEIKRWGQVIYLPEMFRADENIQLFT